MPTLSALAERAHPVIPPGHTPGFVPSAYQQAFFDTLLDARAGDIQLNAVAGSGKTKSIEEGVKLLPPSVRRTTLLTAFNTHIKRELTDRQSRGGIPREVTIQTIHGLGYGACMRAFQPKDKDMWVNGQKYDRLTDLWWQARTPSLGENGKLRAEAVDAMKKLVRLAMLTLTEEDNIPALVVMAVHFSVEVPDEFGQEVFGGIAQVLRWGREGLPSPDRVGYTYHPREFVSFDDMVYLPVVMDLPVPQYDLCFIDESQDFNAAQLALLLKARNKGGRTVWVGDPRQAIYGFTGADAESFDRIQAKTGATRLLLPICYRCAKSVIRLAKVLVPGIEAADSAPEGLVEGVGDDIELLQLAENHYYDSGRADQTLLLLCRTNAPLIGAALELIRRGIPVTVKGRDIGQQLAKTIEAIAALPGFVFSEFPRFAERYRTIKLSVLAGRDGMEMQVAAIQDIIESCHAVFEAALKKLCYDIAGVTTYVRSLFDDNDNRQITLSSIHKAKGLEADRVGILSSELMPHPMAKPGWQYEQELNLAYVAATRARLELYISGAGGVVSAPLREVTL